MPSSSPNNHPKKHEEFKTQLVHDVFGRENKGKVPMEKVAMLIWQFRDDPAVVQFMAQFVAKVSSVLVVCWFLRLFMLSFMFMLLHYSLFNLLCVYYSVNAPFSHINHPPIHRSSPAPAKSLTESNSTSPKSPT